jgi:glycosyltransferase involved in cell wall biosynthesis
LQVLTQDGVGGTEHMLAALLERSNHNALSMELVTLSPPGPIAERLAGRGIRVRALGDKGLLVAFARLGRIIRRERFDVVNAYGFKATAVARVLTRALSRETTFVCGVRGLHMSELEDLNGPKSRIVLFAERLGAPLVDIYDANSRGALELLKSLGVPASKLMYIPNGIDAHAWLPGDRTRHRETTILCVARFVPRKRQADVVAAARHLVMREVPFRLHFVGDGPTRSRIAAEAADLGNRITFLGEVTGDALRAIYSDADIFCLASMWEGMAGAVMEAMASGLPVVGTDVNGISDLVDDGSSGFVVPPADPTQIAIALERLATNQALRERMGAAGRARIEANFSLDGMVAAKENLYMRAADGI